MVNSTLHGQSDVGSLTSEEFLSKLRKALSSDGDFPASAKVVNKLKEMTSDPRTTAQQVAELILREPSLSTRILHLVNSSFYRRAKPIMTVSQAVVAVGMKSIADLCAGLVLLQRFIPMARKGGPFADCFKQSVVTSLLSSSFSAEIGGTSEGSSNELGYISGFFAEIGILLLAYYFPKMYEATARRAHDKNITIAESLKQITGLNPLQISVEVIQALGLPKFYIDVLEASQNKDRLTTHKSRSLDEEKIIIAGKSVNAGYYVSAAISSGDKARVDEALKHVSDTTGVELDTISSVLGRISKVFEDHCITTEIDLPELPQFLEQYQPAISGEAGASDSTSENQQVLGFIEEIKQAVTNREPSASIITSVMEALMFGLSFERVVLLLFDSPKKKLTGRMALGISDFTPSSVTRLIEEHDHDPDGIALRESRPVFQGDPILEKGWPFVVIPIGSLKKGLGVIYGDRLDKDQELTDREKAYIGILADLVERSIAHTK